MAGFEHLIHRWFGPLRPLLGLALLASPLCSVGSANADKLITNRTSAAGNTYVGSPGPGYRCELPVHTNQQVSIWMESTEIQSGLWSQVCAYASGTGYDLPAGSVSAASGLPVSSSHPVVEISWYDAVKWCNARSEMDGLTPAYYTDSQHKSIYRSGEVDLLATHVDWNATGYRLPTEAEWETAARGGRSGVSLPWAQNSSEYFDILTTAAANFSSSGTVPVKQYAPNGLGLYDMGGNVSEWCWDWYDSEYYEGLSSDATNPTGPTEKPALAARVTRGGSWFTSVDDCRCSARSAARPSDRNDFQGFRTVRKTYLGTPSEIKVDNGPAPVLSWETVTGANRYEIWRYDGKSGTTNLLATTTASSFKDTTAALQTRYVYYLKAMGSYADGFLSTAQYGRTRLDFDGDGRSDVGCYFPTMGQWYVFLSDLSSLWTTNYAGGENTKAVAGFFDSDNLCDYGTYSAPNGQWRIKLSEGGTFENNFGFDGTFPIAGDFDGDGLTDFGCYYPPNGGWFIYRSKTAALWVNNFGFENTIPVTGDFDGDGVTDFGCYYPPNGGWFIYKSKSGTLWADNFGYEGTVPITGDFDGDGVGDFGCYDASTGYWFIFKSSTSSLWTTRFGFEGTTPVVGDYDGDRTDDFGCYYPPTGGWYLFKSSDGFWSTQFGYDGTMAIQ